MIDAANSESRAQLTDPSKSKRQSILTGPKTTSGSKVETMDLADCKGDQWTPSTPRGYGSLQQLHEKINKDVPHQALTKTPSFANFSKNDRLQLSLKDSNFSSDRPSTDYDGDWMTSLPSPSSLINPPRESRVMKDDRAGSGDHSSPSVQQLPSNEDKPVHTNALEDIDLSPFDDDNSDLEDAMVGLSDSVRMQDCSQTDKGVNCGKQAKAGDERQGDSLPSLCHSRVSSDEEILAGERTSEKLFLSTDSPEKRELPMEVQATSVGPEDGIPLQASPPHKRRKVHFDTETAFKSELVEQDDKMGSEVAPIIKPGHPAWVYEFDPALIAEFQDFVEFV